MDPIFYPQTGGLPTESKLATYMVTAQSPEFIPQRISASPNFYSAYHQPMVNSTLNGCSGNNSASTAGANVVGSTGVVGNGVGVNDANVNAMSTQSAQPALNKSLNGTPPSLLGMQKVAAAVAAQQKQQQLQHQQQQQQQQQQLVNGSTVVAQMTTTAMLSTSYIVNSPLNGVHGSLLNESPQGLIGEKSPPEMTPQLSPLPPTTLPANVHQENVGGTIYFYPTSNHANTQNTNGVVNSVVDTSVGGHHATAPSVVAPITPLPPGLLYTGHIYPGPASHVISMQPKSQLETAFFMPEEMRSEILARNEISNLMFEPMEAAQHSIPLEVDNYHSLYPLEALQTMHGKIPVLTSAYKATHCSTGIKYCLRRLHGFRLQSTKCMTLVDMWKKLNHSNVAQLREVFTTKAFGDNSLVLVYDYYPGSQTLLSKYFTPTPEPNGYTDPFQGDARPFSHKSNLHRTSNGALLSEATIWAIIMQLTAGLRAMHQAGLACRALDPTKIIVTGRRVRFSFCGVADISQFDPNANNPLTVVNLHQQEDLTALGRLVLALACRCLNAVQRDNVQTSIDLVARHYSSDLRNFIVYLFATTQRRSVTDLMPMIGARFYTQLEALQSQCDMQEDELSKEMENGRLYRMLIKLNYINERPDFNLDVTWSETGDRYMLKLFRDYLFHSVTEDGRPWLDHAHILQCLNKLDAGSLERVQLMSRDEQSLLIVTYAELKNCLEHAFAELMANAA